MRFLAMATGLVVCIPLALGLGCASKRPIAELTFATTRPGIVEPEILRSNVKGTFCYNQDLVTLLLTPPWRARRANHGYAIAAAINSVPEANILTDIEIRVQVNQYVLFTRTCAIVVGDAGRL